MLTRENLKLAGVVVVCLLLAWTGPSIAHGVHAKFAHNADKVDGKHAVGPGASKAKARRKLVAHNGKGELPGRFLPGAVVNESETTLIVTTAGPAGWVNENGADPGTYGGGYFDTAASGVYQMPLPGVQHFGGKPYGLHKIQLCYDGDDTGINGITETEVWGAGTNGSLGDSLLAEDLTDRLTEGCFVVPVNAGVPHGANVRVFVNDANVDLGAVKAFWKRGITAFPAPRAGREKSGE